MQERQVTRRITLATFLAVALAVAATRAWAAPVEGRWTLDTRGASEQVHLNLRRSWNQGGSRGSWSHTDDVSRSELRGLPATGRAPDGPISLAVVRDAGTLHLEGRLDHGRGEGRFTFEADAAFATELRRAGFQDVGDEDLIRLCVEDLGRDWIRDMGSLGLPDPTLSDLLRLHHNGVRPEFVRALVSAGYDGLDVERIIRLSVNGVSAEYVRELAAPTGRSWPVEQIVRFHNNGVEAAYVSALAPYFAAEDLVRLHNNGVEVTYVRDLRALGYESATANDFVRLRNHDVSPAFARRARELHGPVSTEDLIRLRVNGAE